MKYDAIFFDLDGTLWNSTTQIMASYKEFAQNRGLKMPSYEVFMSAMGLTNLNFVKRLFPDISDAEALSLFSEASAYENIYIGEHGADQFDGVYEMFEELSKKYKLCIISNCGVGYIEAYMKSMKTGKYIFDHLSHGDTGLTKAENISIVKDRNGFSNPIYVGDTILDMQSAEIAGIDFIHAGYGFGKFPCKYPEIDKPLDLLTLL